MPIYVYKCQDKEKCNHQFEEVESIKSDGKNKKCPKCKKKATRIITTGNFHLKGGGWSDTGYA